MSSQNSSQSHPKNEPQEQRDYRKLFITDLPGNVSIRDLEDKIRKLFESVGGVDKLVVKKNRNTDFHFGFVDMKDERDGQAVVHDIQHVLDGDIKFKVDVQDNNKRRKDSHKGCYICDKMGHFARECPNKDKYEYRRRDRSDSSEEMKRRKHKKKHSRSRSRKGHKEKSRDEKKKKKHKKNYSSDSF